MSKPSIIEYSPRFPGDSGNFDYEAQADVTQGYVGITIWDNGKPRDRVLLSPGQWEKVKRFVSRRTKQAEAFVKKGGKS